MAAVEKEMDAEYQTVWRWSLETFHCRYNCPWHGWDKLKDESNRVMSVKFQKLNEGDFNPASQEAAMAKALAEGDLAPVAQRVVADSVRADIERIRLWEYLWSKVYYDVTGVALEYSDLRGFKESSTEDFALKEQYSKGLRSTRLEAAISLLSLIETNIDRLRHRATGGKQPGPMLTVHGEKQPPMDLHQLRELAASLDTTTIPKLTETISNGKVEVSAGRSK